MKKRGGSGDKALPEPPAPSPADQQLFRSAITDVKPITPHGRITPCPTRPPPIPLSHMQDDREVIFESLHDPVCGDVNTEHGEELSFARPGISRQILRRLRRGEWGAQAELDLHGLIKLEAKIELVGFLSECRRRSIRCIRIIHGKGLRSKNREPVLKLHVQHWLMQREEVLAFVQARPADGGGGAVMVLLKTSTPG